jgi:hypothetical protein
MGQRVWLVEKLDGEFRRAELHRPCPCGDWLKGNASRSCGPVHSAVE